MENTAFTDRNDGYYNMFKMSIVSLIPEGPHAILDVGCAAGRLGRKLKELNKARELVGVEIFEDAADEASKYYEKVYHADVEHAELDYKEYFDFVVCSDILEHLKDPHGILRKIHGWLKRDGFLLSCIPNVRFWRVSRDLIFLGRWEYAEAGILDKTHLRFFTRRSFSKCLDDTGFDVQHYEMVVDGRRNRLFNTITCRLFEEFVGSQIIVVAKKRGSAVKE